MSPAGRDRRAPHLVVTVGMTDRRVHRGGAPARARLVEYVVPCGDVRGAPTPLPSTHPTDEGSASMRYSDHGTGITRDSITFFREHRHRLGDIVQATVRFPGFDDPHDPYLMMLTDSNGDEIALSGCTAGYPGEGPRGAMQVLVECGWPADQA